MRRFQLLAIDIDGTLVNSHDQLTSATRDALVRAGEAGIRIVLATGRRYSRTLHLVEPLAIDVPLVTASGSLVKDPHGHQTLYRADFDLPTLGDASVLVDRFGFHPLMCADTFDEGFDFYCDESAVLNPFLEEYMRLNPGCGQHRPGLVTCPPEGVFNVFTMGTQVEMLALQAELERQMPGRLTTHVLRSPRYRGFICEIAMAGITKWSGIQWLAKRWAIPDNAICAVGDDVNDLAMIEGAGLGVAMGNAQPVVKAVADRIAATHDEDGLVQVVKWLLEE
jgi:Cof subfamily protein (haloacid dehalogenase superfamily)